MVKEHKPGDVFHDKVRGDYFRLLFMAEDGEWEIVSATDLDYVKEFEDDGSGTGEWFHPETLSERVAKGEVEEL